MGTQQEREGSEKTQPDDDALPRQIQELREQRDLASNNENKYRCKITDQQTAMARVWEDVQRLRRTVAGSGFSLARLKQEVDNGRKGNQELEHRNHKHKKELRRVGRKLLDLGN